MALGDDNVFVAIDALVLVTIMIYNVATCFQHLAKLHDLLCEGTEEYSRTETVWGTPIM